MSDRPEDTPPADATPASAQPLPQRERFRGALLGFAVGDALGAPAEFLSREQVAERWGLLTEMVGGGCHNVAPGEVTDDTEMLLCLAESLAASGDFDPQDVVRRYMAWFESNPTDVGLTVRTTLLSIRSGTPWERAARRAHVVLGRMSAGNGSLMRSPAIALRYANDPARRREVALQESMLTHFDRLAGWACVAYTDIVAAVLRDALEASRAEIVASGYVLDTLKAALWAVLHSEDFEQALIEAVNLGDDADTVGALTGALAGALYGERAIPVRWSAALTVTQRLNDAAERLADLAGVDKQS